MITDSIVLQTLSAPCFNRCRHCLLSSDGRVTGAAWDRSAALARRFKSWLSLNRPEVRFDFGFGYSMEHPRLGEALDTLNELGSVMGRMLQMDGLKLRDRSGAEALLITCLEHGVKHLNFTFYGTSEYHDAFAGRQGDFSSLLQLVRLAAELGFERSAGIMLTAESAPMIGALVPELREAGLTAERSVRLLVPHSEGRGGELEAIRARRRENAQRLLFLSGVMPVTKGSRYLRAALVMASENPALLCNLEGRLYPAVALRCGGTPAGVERCLRYAVQQIWPRMEPEERLRLLPRCGNRPGVKLFLSAMAERMNDGWLEDR